MKWGLYVIIGSLSLLGAQQVPNPTQSGPAPVDTGQPAPVFRVTVVSRTITAINYHHRTGTTKIDFRGTALMPEAKGEARVESRMGSTKIETDVDHLKPPASFGPEFLTYVLWAITPEGRAQNLGELVPDGDHSKLLSTTDLQAFGLIVTAEPYFAVTQPSDVVVMENFVRDDTTGTIQQVNARYELLQRGAYTMRRSDYKPVGIDPKGPLQVAEAQNAVELARMAGAERYAPDTLQKAETSLQNAEGFVTHHNRKRAETNAREAAQMAEDARIITIRKAREEADARERAAAAEREAQAKAQAEAEAQRRAAAETEREAAERARQEALAASQQAERQKAEADAARRAAEEQQQAAQAEAERARQAAEQASRLQQQSEAEKSQLRQQLQQQLNTILETRDTARGLIVNMSDVLFDFGKYSLRSGAREKLAKIAGIVMSHPGLKLEVEGHTDNIGSDQFNQRLSEQRADAVREYLLSQGVPADSVTARGFGKTRPVASNDSAAGRQQNRRVEMVVSGDIIGSHPPEPRTDNNEDYRPRP